jgi:hypothetical protein
LNQTIEQTVSGLGALYNLGPVVTAALAAYAIATDGNVVEGVWSIGGPLPTDELTSPLLGTGQGLYVFQFISPSCVGVLS